MVIGRTSSNIKLLCQSLAKNYVINKSLPKKYDDFRVVLSNLVGGYVRDAALFDGAGRAYNYLRESESDASIWSIIRYKGKPDREIRCDLRVDLDKSLVTIKYKNIFQSSTSEDIQPFSAYSQDVRSN